MPDVHRVDLLAHYSAPATKTDDLRYQAQANAYRHFMPAKPRRLNIQSNLIDGDSQLELRSVVEETVFLDDTQAALQALCDDISPRKCLPSNAADLHRSRLSSQHEAEQAYTSHSCPSSHLSSPVMWRSNKRRRLDTPVREQLTGASRLAHEHQTRPSNLQQPQPSQLEVRTEHSSELPTSYSLSDLASSSITKDMTPVLQRSTSDPGPTTNTAQHNAGPEDSSPLGAPPTEAAPTSQPDETTTDNEDITESQSESAEIKLIIAPPPSPGIGKFETSVTPQLQLLIDSPTLHDAYKVLATNRQLQILERGHWLISVASWSNDLKHSFWTFLDRFIKGRGAGWGIMCTWSPIDQNSGEPDTVKAFCWGEIVKHTYLLLYVASQGKIRRQIARWIDCRNQVVVRAGRAAAGANPVSAEQVGVNTVPTDDADGDPIPSARADGNPVPTDGVDGTLVPTEGGGGSTVWVEGIDRNPVSIDKLMAQRAEYSSPT